MRRSTGFAVSGIAVIAAAFAGCQSACTSARLAPEHSDAERERAAATTLPYTVTVEPGRFPPIYAKRLADALQRSGLFREVRLAGSDATPGQLVARVASPSEGAAVIPIFTALTLGLFPTWAEETWGLGFTLEAADAPTPAVAIDYRWSGTTVLGWASALLNLSPARGGGDPYEGTRYAQHVAATIAPHASEIDALVARDAEGRTP